jgi:hypothetical protein
MPDPPHFQQRGPVRRWAFRAVGIALLVYYILWMIGEGHDAKRHLRTSAPSPSPFTTAPASQISR